MSGTLARFELSAQARRRSEDLAPAASTPRASVAPVLAHPSTELVARAPCQLRHPHARPVRAARARLRQQRRIEVDESRKRDAQTRGAAGALERDVHAGTFLPEVSSRGRIPSSYPRIKKGPAQPQVVRQVWSIWSVRYQGELLGLCDPQNGATRPRH